MNLSHYELLSHLFDYPSEDYVVKVKLVNEYLQKDYSLAGDLVQQFADFLPKNADPKALLDIQELFIRSFDVQAVTTLDVGYIMFGDDYKRGEVLVNLNREHREHENDCGMQLADHLPNVLRLLPKLEDKELVNDLIHQLIGPSLRKMIGEFDPNRIEQKNKIYQKHYKTLIDSPVDKQTAYSLCLKAVYVAMQKDFDLPDMALEINEEEQSEFLQSVERELKIEGEQDNATPKGQVSSSC